MNERDKALLQDMLEFSRRALRRVQGKQLSDLQDDDEALGGLVVRELAVIGEAASHLSPEFMQQHPELELPKIIGMRNRLVHGYRYINWNVVWTTTTGAIPILVQQLETLLAAFEADADIS